MNLKAALTSLKPCPFCASTGGRVVVSADKTSWVYCDACHTSGPSGYGEEEGIERWNKAHTMTEKTIAEVLAQYPDCKEFVCDEPNVQLVYIDEDGDVMLREEDGATLLDSVGLKYIRLINFRPKPKKRKVTLDVWLDIDRETGHWTHMSDNNSIDRNGLPRVPATLTYETEEPEPIKLKRVEEWAVINSDSVIIASGFSSGLKAAEFIQLHDLYRCRVTKLTEVSDD